MNCAIPTFAAMSQLTIRGFMIYLPFHTSGQINYRQEQFGEWNCFQPPDSMANEEMLSQELSNTEQAGILAGEML